MEIKLSEEDIPIVIGKILNVKQNKNIIVILNNESKVIKDPMRKILPTKNIIKVQNPLL